VAAPGSQGLVIRRDDIEICFKAPAGREVDIAVAANLDAV